MTYLGPNNVSGVVWAHVHHCSKTTTKKVQYLGLKQSQMPRGRVGAGGAIFMGVATCWWFAGLFREVEVRENEWVLWPFHGVMACFHGHCSQFVFRHDVVEMVVVTAVSLIVTGCVVVESVSKKIELVNKRMKQNREKNIPEILGTSWWCWTQWQWHKKKKCYCCQKRKQQNNPGPPQAELRAKNGLTRP